jgi:curved DNA-binding protein CbpA
MSDYYEELGVSKSASPEEIRAAYRRKAKSAHPDRKGGSDAAMAKINRAYETLSSPQRRLTYDKTGQDAPKPVDLNAREIVVEHCKLFLSADRSDDMLSAIRAGIQKNLQQIETEVAKVRRTAERGRKRLSKIKRKKKGSSFLHTMLNFELTRLEQGLAQAEEKITFHKRALELLDEYESESDNADQSFYSQYRAQQNAFYTKGDL